MNKIEQIREMLSRKDSLTADELTELKALIKDAAAEIGDDAGIDEVAILNELADATDAVLAQEAVIKEATEAAAAQRSAALDRIAKISAEAAPEGDEPAGDEPAAAEDKTPALVASAKSSPSRMVTPTAATPVQTERRKVALVASGNVRGKAYGEEIADRHELGSVLSQTIRSMDREATSGRVIVASASWKDQYPEDRILRNADAAFNTAQMDRVGNPMNLAASGGTSLPVNVSYDMDVWATPARPFRDGIDKYLTDRGGLTYRQPPTLASVSTSTGVWTEATDASPGGSTKSIYTVPVPSPTTTYVNAITSRLQFGNFMGQFDPETVAASTDLAAAYHARQGEIELLTLLQSSCTNSITSAQVLGASRDWFSTIEKMAARFRYVHRLDSKVKLVVVLPEYVKAMLNEDRLRELAHDGSAYDVFGLGDTYWDDLLAKRNIRAIWTLDALTANAGAGTFVDQTLAVQATGAIGTWPSAIMWNVFVDGSVQFFDGGTLNLGVVRDSTLDGTNDYELFSETFEGLGFRGFSGGALQIVSTMLATGASSATATVSVN